MVKTWVPPNTGRRTQTTCPTWAGILGLAEQVGSTRILLGRASQNFTSPGRMHTTPEKAQGPLPFSASPVSQRDYAFALSPSVTSTRDKALAFGAPQMLPPCDWRPFWPSQGGFISKLENTTCLTRLWWGLNEITIVKCCAQALVWRMYSLKMLTPSKFHALGIMPAIYSKFFLAQLTWKRSGPRLPHLRSECVEDAGFWDKRVSCSLNWWPWSVPSSWLPDESIVPMTAAFLFPLRQPDTHICWAAGIGPDCVCTVWSYLCLVLARAPCFSFPKDGVCLLALTASGGNGFLCWDNVLSNRPVDFLPVLFIHQASALKKGYF